MHCDAKIRSGYDYFIDTSFSISHLFVNQSRRKRKEKKKQRRMKNSLCVVDKL